MTETIADPDYIRQADVLQASGTRLLEKLVLIETLDRLGKPEPTGSYRYGLMAVPDIDIETYTDSPDVEKIIDAMAEMLRRPGVTASRLNNYLEYRPTATLPPSVYWGVSVQHEERLWNLDLWFFARSAKLSIDGLHDDWWEDLTPVQRVAILKIKATVPTATSVDIYRAVILGNANDSNTFEKWSTQAL